ncbi:MAG: YicC/YloC family endoribonuclease, partial [Flavobacteriaceae bacterium]
MIQSMTGFGKHVVQLPTKKITVELKSLNSKSLDINVRMPSLYREKELELRRIIAEALKRGKIDFGLYVEITGDETSTEVNEGVVKQYMKQLGAIAKGEEVHLLEMALRLPDAMKTGRDQIDAKDYEAILEALRSAIDQLNSYRNEEGEVLEREFAERMDEMTGLLDRVKEMDPERLGSIRPRLRKAVEDLKTEIDENRFEQELMYYLEKYDITEEKLRLQN